MAIVFTSQQSRFYLESIETASKDLDIPGIQLSVGDTKLLEDAQLRLFSGVHYGLVGKNGVGKSTLLRALGQIGLADLPKHLRILYVDQLESVDDTQTVLSLVLGADKMAVQYQEQADLLEAATSDGGAEACARAVQQVELERLEAELEEARQIATKRSGARGFDARHVLIKAENRVKEAQEALAAELSPETLAAGPEVAQQLLDEVFSRPHTLEPGAAEAEARRILLGLGFTTAQQDDALNKLSAILWLTRYLRQLEGVTLVVVSHDRTFLNAVTQEIIVMKNHKLAYHDGSYDEYVTNTEEKALHLMRMKESVDKKRSHIEKSIAEGVRAAKKSGDDKKLGMVASRRKKLDRLGLEKSAAGHRFQVSKDMIGYHLSNRQEIVVEPPDPTPVWKFPEPGPLRQGGALLELEAVSFGYPTRPGFLRPVLSDVTMNVEMGARIAIVGANGAGKSTLMKLMVGELQPTSGSVRQLPQAKLGVFLQHHVEDLIGKAGGGGTPLSHLAALFPGRKEQELRGHLGSFQIKGHLATQPLTSLSGGRR